LREISDDNLTTLCKMSNDAIAFAFGNDKEILRQIAFFRQQLALSTVSEDLDEFQEDHDHSSLSPRSV